MTSAAALAAVTNVIVASALSGHALLLRVALFRISAATNVYACMRVRTGRLLFYMRDSSS